MKYKIHECKEHENCDLVCSECGGGDCLSDSHDQFYYKHVPHPAMTDADYLAGLEEACSDCKGTGRYTAAYGEAPMLQDSNRHKPCNGTGRKPVFPTLRRDCPDSGPLLSRRCYHDSCPLCEGRAWVPVVDLETALVAAWPKLPTHDLESEIMGALWDALDEGRSLTEAVYAALRQAMEAKG